MNSVGLQVSRVNAMLLGRLHVRRCMATGLTILGMTEHFILFNTEVADCNGMGVSVDPDFVRQAVPVEV